MQSLSEVLAWCYAKTSWNYAFYRKDRCWAMQQLQVHKAVQTFICSGCLLANKVYYFLNLFQVNVDIPVALVSDVKVDNTSF